MAQNLGSEVVAEADALGIQGLEQELLQNFIFSESIENFNESELFADEFHPEVFLSEVEQLPTIPIDQYELEDIPFELVEDEVFEMGPVPPVSLMDTLMQQSLEVPEFQVQKTKPRKKRVEVADDQKKTTEYQVFRCKNNISAKKTRVKDKEKRKEVQHYRQQVKEHNKALHMKVVQLEKMLTVLTEQKQTQLFPQSLFPQSVLLSTPPPLAF